MAYAHYGVERGRVANGRVPLDEIPPGLVGELRVDSIRLGFMQACGIRPGTASFIDNLRWLSDADAYARAVDHWTKHPNSEDDEESDSVATPVGGRLASPPQPTTNPSYLRHLQQLTKWSVCYQVGASTVIALNRYFAVLKTAEASRSIIDCAAFSRALRAVCKIEPVRLPTIPDLLERLARVIRQAYRGKERYGILLSDLRHFFHQIPLDKSVQPFFAVRLRNAAYVWKVLPMGHTVSPLVAQTISYAILLQCGFEAEGGTARIPTFATRPGGVAAVWYDNLIAAGNRAALTDTLNRWTQHAGNYHAVLKYARLFEGASLSPDLPDCRPKTTEEQTPILIGLRIACRAGELLYRHKEANIAEWKALSLAMRPKTQSSLRELARLLGVVMFDAYVATASGEWHPDYQQRVAVGKRIGRTAFSRGRKTRPAWDSAANYAGADADRRLLCDAIDALAQNPWRSLEVHGAAAYLMCSDASSAYWGGVWWTRDQSAPLATLGGKWSDVSRRLHISAQEALATLLSLKNAPAEVRCCDVRVAIDAQAIVYALRRRLSGSATLQSLIDRILFLAHERQLRIVFVWIPGVDNAADVITRPDSWGATSINQINWAAPEAVDRLRKTRDHLNSDVSALTGCEETDAEEIIERFCEDETSVDSTADRFELPSEEGLRPELSTLALQGGQS